MEFRQSKLFEVWFKRKIPSETLWFCLTQVTAFIVWFSLGLEDIPNTSSAIPAWLPDSCLEVVTSLSEFVALASSLYGCMESKERASWWVLVSSFWILGLCARNKGPGVSTLVYEQSSLSGVRQWCDSPLKSLLASLDTFGWSKFLFQTLCWALKHWKWVRPCPYLWRVPRDNKKTQKQKSLLHHCFLRYIEKAE